MDVILLSDQEDSAGEKAPAVLAVSRNGGKIMKIKKAMIAAMLCLTLVGMTVCSGCDDHTGQESVIVSADESTAPTVTFSDEDKDVNYSESDAVIIDLSTGKDGEGAAFREGTLTISAAGTYILRGTLENGGIVIHAGEEDTVRLVLENAAVTSCNAPALYASQCAKTIILLPEGTKNVLSDGSTDTSDDDSDSGNAAVYVQNDLTILGEGMLTVNGNSKNGITSADTLRITGGMITVNAVKHGIMGKNNLAVQNGNVTVTCGGDGLRSTYSDMDEEQGHVYIADSDIAVTSKGDGVQAEKRLIISGGTMTLMTGGGADASDSSDDESSKGVKAGKMITISSGVLDISSLDDAIHSNGDVSLAGAVFTIKTAAHGVHADDTISFKSGTITIEQSKEGLEGTVVDISGGLVDITASDDGINASDGSDTNQFGGEMPPDGFNPNGEMPPDGFNPNGEMPPDGFNPNGEAPQGNGSPDDTAPSEDGEETNRALIRISGGTVYIHADGDGIDANGDIIMTDGTLIVNGTTSQGDGILDHDGSFMVSGGTIIGAGTSSMLELPDDSSSQQMIAVLFDTMFPADTLVYITDSKGSVTAAMSPCNSFNCFIVTSDQIKAGETYTIYTGGEVSGESTHGYYSKATVSGGTVYSSFTLGSDIVSYVNADGLTVYTGGMGGRNGGRPGGNRGQMPAPQSA